MIYVFAIVMAKPGKRAELLTMFLEHAPQSLKDPGCKEYRATVDSDELNKKDLGPDTYAVIERWASADDFRAHRAALHMKEYGDRTNHLVADRALHVLTELP
jgi:quinol monooxygenase YgiN